MPAALVGDGAGGGDRRVLEGTAQLVGQPGCGRLLDDLLVAPLERAVAGAQRPHLAVGVGQHLHLDVPPPLDVRLDEDLAVPEGGCGLRAGCLDLAVQGREFADDAHAAPAAPGRRLDQYGQVVRRDAVGLQGGRQGTPAPDISFLAPVLEAMASIAAGGGPIHTSPASRTARAKPAFSDRKP